MENKKIRTRFAPSPTGFMHVGNLRTALYAYLTAKSCGGSFVLRIEDTDQGRLVEGAVNKIYETLEACGLKHDEGPDIGGAYGPYIQSERLQLYQEAANKLIKEGKAYRCFCSEERLSELKKNNPHAPYDRHCRNLSPEEIKEKLEKNLPFTIRQKMPLEGMTSYNDAVFGKISVENDELEDQILIKSDGFPTYNFANVVDDSSMEISHILRGSEYLSSTPKYKLLYEALGLPEPVYVHLPLILGEDGEKLSKRHGSTSFSDLIEEGYIPEAIINYLAFLGWSPKSETEIFTLDELSEHFNISGISKSPSIFDYNKLAWYNREWIKRIDSEYFTRLCRPYFEKFLEERDGNYKLLAELLRERVDKLSDIPEKISFIKDYDEYFDKDFYFSKKMKTDADTAPEMLKKIYALLSDLREWNADSIKEKLTTLASDCGLKNGAVMWPLRIAVSGAKVTPGGAVEMLLLFGKDTSLLRIEKQIRRLEQ